MSASVFPTLAGLNWNIVRTPMWNNILNEAASGKEVAIALWSYPKWQWELNFNFLRSSATFTELQQLVGFFNSRQGRFDTFLYQDSEDNSVTLQTIGTGNGSTAAYQLIRSYGGFIEPILAPNTVSVVALAGVSIPAAGYSAPTNGALSQSAGGALGATTYYVKCAWVTNSGETLPSTETSFAVSANNVLNVAAPASAPAGAIGWDVYVSTTTGAETQQNGATPIALGTPWVEPTSGLVAGVAPAVANTTGWSVSTWGAATPGILTFAGNVKTGIAITSTFTYYFPVRFLDDASSFKNFMYQLWDNGSIKFRSVK